MGNCANPPGKRSRAAAVPAIGPATDPAKDRGTDPVAVSNPLHETGPVAGTGLGNESIPAVATSLLDGTGRVLRDVRSRRDGTNPVAAAGRQTGTGPMPATGRPARIGPGGGKRECPEGINPALEIPPMRDAANHEIATGRQDGTNPVEANRRMEEKNPIYRIDPPREGADLLADRGRGVNGNPPSIKVPYTFHT